MAINDDMNALYEDPEVRAFLDQFERDVLPNMMKSALVCCIHNDAPDPKLCLEVGAAILLDKPLLLCVRPGAIVPDNLRQCAARIVEIEAGRLTEITKDRVETAIKSMLKHDPRTKKREQ